MSQRLSGIIHLLSARFAAVFAVLVLLVVACGRGGPSAKESATELHPPAKWWFRTVKPSLTVRLLQTPTARVWCDTPFLSLRWVVFGDVPAGPPGVLLDSGPVRVVYYSPRESDPSPVAEMVATPCRVAYGQRRQFAVRLSSRCSSSVYVDWDDSLNSVWARWSPVRVGGKWLVGVSAGDTGWFVFPLGELCHVLGHASEIPRIPVPGE